MLVLTSLSVSAQNDGEKSFGLKTGYVSRNNSALAGLVFECPIGKYLRLAPSIGVVFRNENLDALTVDADFHWVVKTSHKCRFYPLLGVAFNSWNKHGIAESEHDDVTTHSNGLGMNAGAGFEVHCSSSLKLGLEAKYTLIRHNPNAQVAAKIAYVF